MASPHGRAHHSPPRDARGRRNCPGCRLRGRRLRRAPARPARAGPDVPPAAARRSTSITACARTRRATRSSSRPSAPARRAGGRRAGRGRAPARWRRRRGEARYAALEAWPTPRRRPYRDRPQRGRPGRDRADAPARRRGRARAGRDSAAAGPGVPPADRDTPADAARCARRAAGLDWVEDETNRDPKFLRNRIRHELLPLLAAAYATDVVPSLARVARRARETVDALDRTAAAALERLATVEDGALTLPRGALGALPAPVAAETLRQAAARLGSRAPLRAWAHRGLRRILAPARPAAPVQARRRHAWKSAGTTCAWGRPRCRLWRRAPLSCRAASSCPRSAARCRRGWSRRLATRPPRTPECVAFDAADLPSSILVRARRRRRSLRGVRRRRAPAQVLPDRRQGAPLGSPARASSGSRRTHPVGGRPAAWCGGAGDARTRATSWNSV